VIAISTGQSLSVGRLKSCDIHLDDESVSRRHCALEAGETSCRLDDLESANGTFVNEERVGKAELRAGDRLRVGATVLECVRATAGPAKDPPTSLTTASLSFAAEEAQEGLIRRTIDPNRLAFLSGAQSRGDTGLLQSAQRYVSTLSRVSELLSRARSVESLFDSILSAILDVSGGDRAAILMQADDRADVDIVALRVQGGGGDAESMVLSKTIVNDVLERGVSVFTDDALAHERYGEGQSIVRQRIRSVMCAPMRTTEAILGVLYVDSRSAHEFSDVEVELLAAIGNQAGVAVHRARLMGEMERLFLDVTKAIAAIIDAKDGYTHRHSERVAAFAVRLAHHLDFSTEERAIVELSALLHDVGKIGVPDAILNKPGTLTEEEFLEMRQHPVHGARMLGHIQNPRISDLLPGVKYHHERWDGTGYPEGLRGDAIPMLGRLLAVADFLDAVTSDRSYHTGKTLDEAVAMMKDRAGTAFDPGVVDAALELHARGELALPVAPGLALK
jgi:HD-GYP domain-containing protein (c-di-GMP phosphodiesterase class II)